MIYGENFYCICHVCGAADETVAIIVSKCSKLVQKEYKQLRHDNVAKCFIGSYKKNRDSIEQRNGTNRSQKKF